MNLYIRTLGFDNMTSEAEAKFIKTGIRESIKEGFVIRHEKLDRGVIILRLSNSTGLCMEDMKRMFLNMSIIFRLLWGRL
jgi:hypothetical protein